MSPIQDPRFSKVQRDAALQEERTASDRAAQLEYVKPLAVLGIGLPIAIALVVQWAGTHPDINTASVTGRYLLQFGLSVVLGMAALVVATKLMAGSSGPLHLAVLRMAGALAVFDVTYLLLGGNLQITMYPGLVATFVLVGMIVWLFEMDLAEGALVGIIVCTLKLAATIGSYFLFA